MSTWSGFTDEDLQKVKRQSSNEDSTRPTRGTSRGRPGQRRRPQRTGVSNEVRPTGDLPKEQRLSQPKASQQPVVEKQLKQAVGGKAEDKGDGDKAGGSINTSGTGTGVQTQQKLSDVAVKDDNKAGGWEKEMKEEEELMDEEQIVSMEMSNLDKFREQQKMIEELNKKKRQMLATAIQQRQKEAKAESAKLTRIQSELEKMDQMLTVDVSVIRDRIEEASRQYTESQKRYDRAEKEFIESKMNLFHTQEQKEQLTEHLYTVIHQNEVRKASKLKELMEKLEMENSGEDSEITELVRNMEMPSLTVLNSMQARTITGPKSPPANPRISVAPGDKTNAESQAGDKNRSRSNSESPKNDDKNKSQDNNIESCAVKQVNKSSSAEETAKNADKCSVEKSSLNSENSEKILQTASEVNKTISDELALSKSDKNESGTNKHTLSNEEVKSQDIKTSSQIANSQESVTGVKETVVINNTDKSAVKC